MTSFTATLSSLAGRAGVEPSRFCSASRLPYQATSAPQSRPLCRFLGRRLVCWYFGTCCCPPPFHRRSLLTGSSPVESMFRRLQKRFSLPLDLRCRLQLETRQVFLASLV